LQDEKTYNPVTVLGVAMNDEIINSLVALLVMILFASINKGMGISNPF
jgi:hypothetical protein